MHAILRPLTEVELEQVVIKDSLFPVGRLVPPFSAYPATVTNQLSRRHARVFTENEKFFVTDLGSKNGTSVNGQNIQKRPAELNHGA